MRGRLEVLLADCRIVLEEGDSLTFDPQVADVNGIVIIQPEEAERVYEAAREYEDRAPYQRRWLEAGGSLGEISGLTAAQLADKVGCERMS